jgi:hypothetical protein
MKRNLDHLPKLHELVTSHRKRRFASYREMLKRNEGRIRTHYHLLRVLACHGLAVDWEGWDAEQRGLRVQMFERDENKRIKFVMHCGIAKPVLARLPDGKTTAGVLAKVLGVRLSRAAYQYPEPSQTPGVFYVHCSFQVPESWPDPNRPGEWLENPSPWRGYTISWQGIFNDRPGQKCRAVSRTSTHTEIECRV